MFYVLIFSIAAIILVVAFFSARSRRQRTMRGEDVSVGAGGEHHASHGTHPNAATKKNRKAKRSQSQHDRRKRH